MPAWPAARKSTWLDHAGLGLPNEYYIFTASAHIRHKVPRIWAMPRGMGSRPLSGAEALLVHHCRGYVGRAYATINVVGHVHQQAEVMRVQLTTALQAQGLNDSVLNRLNNPQLAIRVWCWPLPMSQLCQPRNLQLGYILALYKAVLQKLTAILCLSQSPAHSLNNWTQHSFLMTGKERDAPHLRPTRSPVSDRQVQRACRLTACTHVHTMLLHMQCAIWQLRVKHCMRLKRCMAPDCYVPIGSKKLGGAKRGTLSIPRLVPKRLIWPCSHIQTTPLDRDL